MTNMLELTLTLNQDKYAPGEPINSLVRLRNAGSEAVKVNGRLAINTPYAPEEMRDIAFAVSDPSGAVVDFQLKVNVGAPADNEFKTLQPGEVIEQSYNLARYYDLKRPGTYSVQAAYQNQSEPGMPPGTSVWKGEVKSAEARFAVQR